MRSMGFASLDPSLRIARLLRRQLDPVVVGAGFQRIPVGRRDVPVDDGAAWPLATVEVDIESRI
jgi:hypothetical protein